MIPTAGADVMESGVGFIIGRYLIVRSVMEFPAFERRPLRPHHMVPVTRQMAVSDSKRTETWIN
jgi:hypothetical protein